MIDSISEMRVLAAITASITFSTSLIGASPAFAEVDSKIHKLCSDVKDYAGCVQAQNGINESSSTAGKKAKAKTQEIYRKLFNFNKRQFIANNPSMSEWVKANPKLAKSKIDSQFLFFREVDLEKERLYKLSSACIVRGTGITDSIRWKPICEDIKEGNSKEAINQYIYSSIKKEIKVRESREIAEERCTLQEKQLRSTADGKICMNDYEFATYQEQQRKRIAEEEYRREMLFKAEQQERDRAIQAGLEGFANSLKNLAPSPRIWSKPPRQQTRCSGTSSTSYGTTYSNLRCY